MVLERSGGGPREPLPVPGEARELGSCFAAGPGDPFLPLSKTAAESTRLRDDSNFCRASWVTRPLSSSSSSCPSAPVPRCGRAAPAANSRCAKGWDVITAGAEAMAFVLVLARRPHVTLNLSLGLDCDTSATLGAATWGVELNMPCGASRQCDQASATCMRSRLFATCSATR